METTETIAARSPGTHALRRALTVLMLGGTAIVAVHDWAGVGSSLHSAIGGPSTTRSSWAPVSPA